MYSIVKYEHYMLFVMCIFITYSIILGFINVPFIAVVIMVIVVLVVTLTF